MRTCPRVVLLSFAVFVTIQAQAQQTAAPAPTRDPTALALLQWSVAAMGGTVPLDSVASGSVTLANGASNSSGNIVIQTRALDQTSQLMQFPDADRQVIFSKGQARNIVGTQSETLQAELSATSQCPYFPLPLLVGILNNPDEAIVYIGLESEKGVQLHHIRYFNSFISRPKLRFLAEFTTTDLWIHAGTALPHRLSYARRAGRASEPRTQVDVYFSNYQNVGGVAYPFSIQELLNGSPSRVIAISTVAFNTGLTDANFPVE